MQIYMSAGGLLAVPANDSCEYAEIHKRATSWGPVVLVADVPLDSVRHCGLTSRGHETDYSNRP